MSITEDSLKHFFDHLDNLRESGATNMLGAAPYLVEAFSLPRDVARDVVAVWLQTFDDVHSARARAKVAIPKLKAA